MDPSTNAIDWTVFADCSETSNDQALNNLFQAQSGWSELYPVPFELSSFISPETASNTAAYNNALAESTNAAPYSHASALPECSHSLSTDFTTFSPNLPYIAAPVSHLPALSVPTAQAPFVSMSSNFDPRGSSTAHWSDGTNYQPTWTYPSPPCAQSRMSTPYASDYASTEASDDAWSTTDSTPDMEQPTFVYQPGREVSQAFTEASDDAWAHALFRCLRAAPNYQMSLQDIYAWCVDNCAKAQQGSDKGWQNSVRHNLSMNQGFEKTAGGSKKNSTWQLSMSALADGFVRSTTQYRKTTKRASAKSRTHTPAPQRQSSGSKGGIASRDAALRRRLRATAPTSYPTSAPAPHLMPNWSSPAPSAYSNISNTSTPSSSSALNTPEGWTYQGYNMPQCTSGYSMDHNPGEFNFADLQQPLPRSNGMLVNEFEAERRAQLEQDQHERDMRDLFYEGTLH